MEQLAAPSRSDAEPPRYLFGNCELRVAERKLLVAGELAHIAPRAFDVLLALLEASGCTLAKGDLLDRVWPGLNVEEHNLAMQVSALRRVVGHDTIATMPGHGYRFAAAVTCLPEASGDGSEPVLAATGPPKRADALRFGKLDWRPDMGIALLDGQRPELGSRALHLLDVLIRERHRVVSKAELLDRVWPGLVVEENNLPVQVAALRKLLGPDAVATVPGRGYRFAMLPTGASQASVVPLPQAPTRGNLPHAGQTLIGRADDLDHLGRLLQAHRLVTIVGAGGIGKTRAALALAAGQASRFAHGAWWVDLGALAAPEEVATAIAASARVQLAPGDSARQLALALASRETLIVLDNCEHLVAETARIAATVLDVTSRVCLLATSQEPLRVEGEQVFRLGGLPLPAAGASLDEARSSAALMLLERRAQSASSRFVLTEAMLPAAIDLCRQLDGIPLAIEMAAARLPQLGATALQAALGERLQWLRNGVRMAPPRQQTLRATLDWSCSLLAVGEQAVLRRLAVFAGNFGLEAAQQVACDPALDHWAVAEALSTLVDRSLVQLHGDEPPRYRLLESLRLYAGEQLQAHSEETDVRSAHMRVMAAIGDAAEQAYWTTPDAPWLARYEPEYDDLHAAFVNACAARDATAGAATLDALYRLDELHLQPVTLAARLGAAQGLLPQADPACALRIRLILGSLLLAQVPVQGLSKLDAVLPAVEMACQLGDAPRLYRALLSVALHATVLGDEPTAASAIAQAQATEQASWPARLKWFGAVHRTYCHSLCGESDAAMASLHRELTYAEQAGSAVQVLATRAGMADIALTVDDAKAAIRLGTDVTAEFRRLGRDAHLGNALSNLCAAYIAAGDLQQAAQAAAEAIEPVWRHERAGYLLDHLSLLAAKQGRFEDAMLLIGFADTWYAGAQYAREVNEAASVRSAMALSEPALGVAHAAALRQRGSQEDFDLARPLARSCTERPAV